MKTLVIYDSYFGNTEKIARSIGEGIGAKVINVAEIKESDLIGLDFLVIGSPTRAFRPTEKIGKFLAGVSADNIKGMKAAAFDTRMDVDSINNGFLKFMVKIFGYAADNIAKKLKNKGANLIGKEGFVVTDTKGPLKEGELERARQWGRSLTQKVLAN